MKNLFISVTFFLLANVAIGQKFNFNLFAGATNYQGDLQDKAYTFNQAHLAGGFGLSYDLTDHFSLRSGILFGKLSANDKYGRNKARNLNFTSNLTEVNLGVEYLITPLGDHVLTPYVFASLALFHFNPYTRDTTGRQYYLRPLSTEGQGFVSGKNYYNLTQVSIPFGGGVKMALSDNINVGLELGFRKTFTDYIDDVSGTYVDESLLLANRGSKAAELAYRGNELKNGSPYPPGGTKRGGSAHHDWYYFTGLTLSFRLGSGNGLGYGNGKHSQYACPVNVR
ncbi:MAG: DUF6089 family protein [Bacteroidota bacterium]|nr:DUF6089 family protein [Bacteroidota bacterium]